MSTWKWQDRSVDGVVACFGGKTLGVRDTGEPSPPPPLDLLLPGKTSAWVQQIHSADVVEAQATGCQGEADALITRRSDLPLAVVTADCVPVLLASTQAGVAVEVGAVHAGWRGVAAEIVARAISRFRSAPTVAWIGPAISLEAYEVGQEVATAVAAVSAPDVVDDAGRRPHVDLQGAVEIQLRAHGISDIRRLRACTFNNPDLLHSYRRDGANAGRNVSAIWLSRGS